MAHRPSAKDNRHESLKLPDELLVRYYRAGEIDHVSRVTKLRDGRLRVQLLSPPRIDCWRDLRGGLGYVPDSD